MEEIYQTVCPFVFSGLGAPTMADGIGINNLSQAARLRFKSPQRFGDELFLVYKGSEKEAVARSFDSVVQPRIVPGSLGPTSSSRWTPDRHVRSLAMEIQEKPLGAAQRSEKRDIGIVGMTCDNCVRRVERALRSVNGVTDVKVDRASARAEVTFDRAKTDIPALHEALLKSGYRPTSTTG